MLVTCGYLLNEGYAAGSGVNSRVISIRAGRGCRAKTVLRDYFSNLKALHPSRYGSQGSDSIGREPSKMASVIPNKFINDRGRRLSAEEMLAHGGDRYLPQ